jgi:hypothetical protein
MLNSTAEMPDVKLSFPYFYGYKTIPIVIKMSTMTGTRRGGWVANIVATQFFYLKGEGAVSGARRDKKGPGTRRGR